MREKSSKQSFAVQPIGLGFSATAWRSNGRGIYDMALDGMLFQDAIYPEAVEPGFLDSDERK